MTKRQREQQRVNQKYRWPLLWLLFGFVAAYMLIYPIAVGFAHIWDEAEKEPLVVDSSKAQK